MNPDKTFYFDPVQDQVDRDDEALAAAALDAVIADAIIDVLPAAELHALCERA